MEDTWRGRGLELAGRSRGPGEGRHPDDDRDVRLRQETLPHDKDSRARALRAGDLVRLRRGAAVGADHWRGLKPDDRYRVVVEAVAAAQRDAVLSHWSAAVVWGLPMVGRRDERVHLVQGPAAGGRSRRDVVRHATHVAVPTTIVDDLRVTSAARTVIDLARLGGFVAGVAAGDAALRSGTATRADLEAEVEAAGKGRGARAARAVATFADRRAESPGESLSRCRMHELGLPAPELQHELRDRGRFVARLDFWWPEHGVVGEFDGRSKYGIDVDTIDPAAALWREKLREDAIRALGLSVARWTWQDAWTATPMAARLRASGIRPGSGAERAR